MATAIWKDATAPLAPAATQVNTTGLINTPSAYNATTGAAATGTASTYDPSNWDVDAKQTVAGQIDSIIKSDSPLMRAAETYSKQQANARGLSNTSMAVGAGRQAVLNAALPIAQQDAQTHATAGQFNTNSTNAANQFNTGNQQQMTLQNTAAQNAMTSQNLQAENQAGQFNASAQNDLTSQINQIEGQAALTNATEANKLSMQNLDNQFKIAVSNADAASKAMLQQMADETKASLGAIEAQYKQAISGSEAAERMFSKVTQNITDIVNNPDITDAAARQAYIQNQLNYLDSGLGLMEAVSGLELDSLLTF